MTDVPTPPPVFRSPNFIVTLLPEHSLQSTIVTVIPMDVLQKVFHRALNTWPDAPPNLVQIADAVQNLSDLHEVMVKRQMEAMMRATAEQTPESPAPTH